MSLEDRRIIEIVSEMERKMEPRDRELLRPLLAEYADDPAGLLEFLNSLSNYDFKYQPTDVRTFATDPYYLGLGGERGILYPGILDILEEIFIPGKYEEVYLDGAIGWGKSTTAEVINAYMVYQLSCLKHPQLFYGLNADDPLAVMNVSVNVTQAKKVVFGRLKEKMKSSPYFKEQFPYDPLVQSELRFPNNIVAMPTAASEGGTIGYTVYGAVMDECVSGDAKILTPEGARSMRDLAVGDKVWGFREGILIEDEVVAKKFNGYKDTIRIVSSSGHILVCTPNHPVLTVRGWVEAGNLRNEDEIYVQGSLLQSRCGTESPGSNDSDEQESHRRAEGASGYPSQELGGLQRGEYAGHPGRERSKGSRANLELSVVSGEAFGTHAEVQPRGRHEAEALRVEQGEGGSWGSSYGLSGSGRQISLGEGGTQAFGRDEGEDVALPNRGHAERHVTTEVLPYLCEVSGEENEVSPFQLRDRGGSDVGRGRFGSGDTLRGSPHPLRGLGSHEEHSPRFPVAEGGRYEGGRGGKSILVSGEGDREHEATSDAGVLLARRDEVHHAHRARVVSVSRGVTLPVYNIETRETHTYVANGIVVHNCNFWQITESSSLARGDKFDQAEHVHELLKRRIESRFVDRGGLLVAVSSSKYPDSFTEKKREDLAERMKLFDLGQALKPKVFIQRMSQWGPKPKSKFREESFWLYLGGKPTKDAELSDEEKKTYSFRPFITREEHEIAPYREKFPERVIAVPMNYWDKFRTDLEGSIRDIAGYPTLALRPWLTEMDKLMEAFERGRRHGMIHPMSMEETSLEDGGRFLPDLCKFDSGKYYFAHVDLAKGHRDKVGLCVGHVERWKTVRKSVEDPETGHMTLVEDVQPMVVLDLMLRIKAHDAQTDVKQDLIRGLLLTLREYGCNLRKVSFDQWNSMASIQAFQRLGIESEEHSVDRTMASYNAFKEAILEDRLIAYSYQPLIEEASGLEHNAVKDKVDHTPNNSKDVADAVAAVCFHCVESKSYALIDPSYGDYEEEDDLRPDPRWKNPARGMQPNSLGKRPRTVEDLMWRNAPGEEDEDDDGGAYTGFL